MTTAHIIAKSVTLAGVLCVPAALLAQTSPQEVPREESAFVEQAPEDNSSVSAVNSGTTVLYTSIALVLCPTWKMVGSSCCPALSPRLLSLIALISLSEDLMLPLISSLCRICSDTSGRSCSSGGNGTSGSG